MAGYRRYTIAEIAEALKETKGFRSAAARRLGCATSTVTNYINRYKKLQVLAYELKEEMLDIAESKLLANIEAGKESSIFFFLKCQGKERGYVERQEFTGVDGAPPIVITHLPVKAATAEEWTKMCPSPGSPKQNGDRKD
jgi:hypothetical protein